MEYGQLFTRAWKICWSNKWLFLLGFLATLGAGTGSNSNFSFDSSELPFGPTGELTTGFVQNIEQALVAALPILLLLLCVGILISIGLWLLRLITQAGMIRAAADADNGEKISFGKAFRDGVRYLPRFIGVNILLYLPLIVLIAVAGIVFAVAFGASIAAAFGGSTGGSAGIASGLGLVALCACLLICLTVPLVIVIMVLYPFAQRSVVLEEQGVFASVRRAWRVLTANLGDSIVLLVLFVVIGVVLGLIVAIVLFSLGILLALPSIASIFFTGSFEADTLIVSTIGLVMTGLIAAVLTAIWTTFRSVSFTLAYGEFMARTPLK